ncbi:uncharacterized protein LOC115704872 [Cannabis sativa]|uniref:uncharacterized protein LOC115704872 n=1 Tax=Cannabis sativa TaxID=3483 RepID=UPI0029C9E6EF|nr:uncharacterized protein LOC115704872 [Cannabis sativa]
MDNQDAAAAAEPVKAKALTKYPFGAASELGVIKKPLPYPLLSGLPPVTDIFIDESIELDENYEEKNDKGFFPAEYGTPFAPRPFLAMAIFVMKEHSKRMDNEVELKYVVRVNQGRVVNWNLNSFTHYLILRGNDGWIYLAKIWSKFIPERGLALWFKMSRGGGEPTSSKLISRRKYWPKPRKIIWATPPGRKPPNFDWP